MSSSGVEPVRIVGRGRELAALFDCLSNALAGHGSLVLVSGAAGIGKTALVRAFSAEAAAQSCRMLTGACYDAGTTLPYGPWLDIAANAARHTESVPPLVDQAVNPDAFVTELRHYLLNTAEREPLVLVLEDLHWADPESIEFLRQFARQIGDSPVLLVATYRDDDLTQHQLLDRALPNLVRESNAHRINLARLDDEAVQTLVAQRYELSAADRARLVSHVGDRSQGIPLYLLELLRSLEEEEQLRRTAVGWELGEIAEGHVPVLVRQVIEGRLERLGPDVRRLLELAAVIGQEVPLLRWRRVSHVTDEEFDDAIERALSAQILEETPGGMQVQFSHALVRDALYARLSLPRRQRWHRQVAEALTTEPDIEPDSVAYHFRQALDPRATDWFIRAGSRAERVAWPTAASHFEAALTLMASEDSASSQRGWLLMRRARLLRIVEPRTALALLESAAAHAEDADDAVLRAYVRFLRGQVSSLAGEGRIAVADLEGSIAEFARLSPVDVARVEEIERQGIFPTRIEMEGHLAAVLAALGRVDEALARTQSIIELAGDTPGRAWWGRAIALALAGRVSEAREAYMIARDAAQRVSDGSSVVLLYLYQLTNIEIPYGADNLIERSRIAREAEAAWHRIGGSHGNVSPRIAWLPTLQIEGEWAEARTLALSGIRSNDATSERDLASATVLARIARAQGDVTLSWELVHAVLPSGPQSAPGYTDFGHSLAMMRVAAGLCLDRDDLAAARAWLDAHDRWLGWSSAVLGRADGQNGWASYAFATGDLPAARHRATQALALASDPRQPLALIEAHRLLGLIESHAGRVIVARQHLETALALVGACAAPYERALTLLAWADLHLRTRSPDNARAALDEASDICTRLGAMPTLRRIESIAEHLSEQTAIMARTAPAGLSPREIEVLRLLAEGRSNREIAETLFLSVRTVERHVTNLYTKIGAHNRVEAITFAQLHSLI